MAKTAAPVLYDRYGNQLERSISDLDPNFLRAGGGAGTSKYSTPAAREPYKYHSWIFACVDRISTPLSALPKILETTGGEIIKTHALMDLFFRPNPTMCGTDLWESTYLAMLLPTKRTPGGQCFWVLESGRKGEKYDLRSGELPTEIWPYSDNFFEPELDGMNHVGWKMVIAGKTIQTFGLNEVIRFRRVNPYSVVQGISPFSPAEIPVLQDIKSDEYNTKFYDNYGAVGGTLSTDSDLVTEKELKAFADWFDDRFSGSGNAGRTVALSHGLKYDRFAMTNLDMQFSEQRKENRQRIQAVYGVNDAELGIFDSGMNRATAEQADRNVWQKSRLPLDRKINDTLNAVWIKWLKPGNMKLKSDMSSVESLRENYSDRIKDSTELIQRGLVPPSEAFRINGVPVEADKYPWMDKVFVPMNLVDVQMLADGAVFGPTTPNTTPEKQAINILSNILKSKSKHPEQTEKMLFKATDIDDLSHACALMDKDKRRAFWGEYERAVLKPGDKSMRDMISKHLYAQRNEMLDNVDKWEKKNAEKMVSDTVKDGERVVIRAPARAREYEVGIDTFVFDLDESQKKLITDYRPEVRAQMEREAKRLQSEYEGFVKWKVTEKTIDKFVSRRKRIVESIDTHRFNAARREIGQIIDTALKENLTVKETADLLRKDINDLYPTDMRQATVIARTEISTISNDSRYEAFKDSGAQNHEWVTAHDLRVRDLHDMVDGEVRSIGEVFSNNITHPNDPAGAPENVINCRCITVLKL